MRCSFKRGWIRTKCTRIISNRYIKMKTSQMVSIIWIKLYLLIESWGMAIYRKSFRTPNSWSTARWYKKCSLIYALAEAIPKSIQAAYPPCRNSKCAEIMKKRWRWQVWVRHQDTFYQKLKCIISSWVQEIIWWGCHQHWSQSKVNSVWEMKIMSQQTRDSTTTLENTNKTIMVHVPKATSNKNI